MCDEKDYPTDEDVDAVLDEFGGDPREAIRALLHDLDALARDYRRYVSKGYIRIGPIEDEERKKSPSIRKG